MKATKQAPALLVLIIIIVLSVNTIMAGGTFGDIIATITAVIGAAAIWFEMKRSKDMAEGEFVINLNESFLNNDDVKLVYRKLISKEPLSEEDRLPITEYLTFFETIYLLLERGVASLPLIDDLFSYRYFLIVNDHIVQDMELIPDAQYYKNLYTLDHLWREYRRRKKLPLAADSLETRNPEYMRYVIGRGKRP